MGTRGSERRSEPARVRAKRRSRADGSTLGLGAAGALRGADEAAALQGTDVSTALREGDVRAAAWHTAAMVMAKRRRRRRLERDTGASGQMREILGYRAPHERFGYYGWPIAWWFEMDGSDAPQVWSSPSDPMCHEHRVCGDRGLRPTGDSVTLQWWRTGA